MVRWQVDGADHPVPVDDDFRPIGVRTVIHGSDAPDADSIPVDIPTQLGETEFIERATTFSHPPSARHPLTTCREVLRVYRDYFLSPH